MCIRLTGGSFGFATEDGCWSTETCICVSTWKKAKHNYRHSPLKYNYENGFTISNTALRLSGQTSIFGFLWIQVSFGNWETKEASELCPSFDLSNVTYYRTLNDFTLTKSCNFPHDHSKGPPVNAKIQYRNRSGEMKLKWNIKPNVTRRPVWICFPSITAAEKRIYVYIKRKLVLTVFCHFILKLLPTQPLLELLRDTPLPVASIGEGVLRDEPDNGCVCRRLSETLYWSYRHNHWVYLHITFRSKDLFVNWLWCHPFQRQPPLSFHFIHLMICLSHQTEVCYLEQFTMSDENVTRCQVSVDKTFLSQVTL